MKELLTKRFWQDVKKTFDEARDDSSREASDSQIPAQREPDNSPAVEVPPPPETDAQ